VQQAQTFLGAAALTLACFLVLPVMQAIAKSPDDLIGLAEVDTANLPPPPPPPPEEEPEEEPEPEEQPPELMEDVQPLDLSQLELALDPGMSDGWLGGDFAVNLNTIGGGAGEDVDALFSLADLDNPPRAIYQPSPAMDARIRKRVPGTVKVLFIVDQRGRVTNPIVKSSTDPVFERAAVSAVKQWKFEPGKRNGKPVRFRMLAPITFPK